MYIVAISGSLRASSTNTALVRAIAALAPQDMEVILYNGLGNLPHFSPDLDGEEAPDPVLELRQQLQAADGVLICTPEYAYGMPGSLKNALDWTVFSGDLTFKAAAAISASPYPSGGERALSGLLLTLKALNAVVDEGATLSIPLVKSKLGSNGEITDPETTKDLQSLLVTLRESVQNAKEAIKPVNDTE